MVQYCSVQYCTVPFSTVQCITIQYCTVLFSTVKYSTVLYSTVSTVPLSQGSQRATRTSTSLCLRSSQLQVIIESLFLGRFSQRIQSNIFGNFPSIEVIQGQCQHPWHGDLSYQGLWWYCIVKWSTEYVSALQYSTV